jgi:hypothetical protein
VRRSATVRSVGPHGGLPSSEELGEGAKGKT